MGICFELHSVSDKNIDRILEHPELIWLVLFPDDPETFQEAFRKNRQPGFWRKLLGKASTNETPPAELSFVEHENMVVDLDKAWHGIHFCLNKTAESAPPPMDFITTGGKYAGTEDVGYGYARLLKSADVAIIHNRISHLTDDDLRKNYKPQEMDELDIYPTIWTRDGDVGLEYITDYFHELQTFIETCERHHLGIAVYFC